MRIILKMPYTVGIASATHSQNKVSVKLRMQMRIILNLGGGEKFLHCAGEEESFNTL